MLTRLRTAMQALQRIAARIGGSMRTSCLWIVDAGRNGAQRMIQMRRRRAQQDREESRPTQDLQAHFRNVEKGQADRTAQLLEAFSTLASGLGNNHDAADADAMAQLLEAFRAGHGIVRSHRFAHVFNPRTVVSFIYPYYNKKDTILESIGSILSQTPKLCDMSQVEIIVVDDGSDDTSVSTILPPQVMYVWRNKFNYGISRSRNLGAKIANGKYLVFVDPDLVLNSDYIDSVIRGFQNFDQRTVFTGYLYDYHYAGCEDPRAAFGVWEQPDVASGRFLCLAGGNMTIHRDLFAEVGGFDDDLIYGEVEDTLFGYQLSKRPDTKIVFSTKLSVRHIPHPVGLAHKATDASWAVCARKYPEMFHRYIIEGVR